MWKIVVGFVLFAGLALFMLNKGGEIDMSGEKHGADATHAPDTAAPAAAVASAPSAAVSAAASAPTASASK